VRHTFDCCDFASLEFGRHGEARQRRLSINQDCTGTAFADLAAVLGTHQPKVFPEDFKECPRRVRREFARFAVNF
jgi:hypothetical protein